MSTDLEETLVAARSVLDSLPLPAPAAIRRRGDQRRRRRHAITAFGLMAVVLGITGSIALLGHAAAPMRSLTSTPMAPTGFAKLDHVGETLRYSASAFAQPMATTISNGTGFAAWQAEDGAHVAAVDLAKGRELWSGTGTVMGDLESLTAVGPMLLAVSQTSAGREVTAVDATGAWRWQAAMQSVVIVNFTVVLLTEGQRLEGRDPVTGELRWQEQLTGHVSVIGMNGRQDSFHAPGFRGQVGIQSYVDSRLLVLDQDGRRLRTYDTRTRAWRPPVQFDAAQTLAYGYEGVAYTFNRTMGGFAVAQFFLKATNADGATSVAFAVPRGYSIMADFRPCLAAVCFLIRGAQKSLLGSVRLDGSSWSQAIDPDAALLSAEAGRVIVAAGGAVLLADDTRVIATFPVQNRQIGAIGNRQVLLFPASIEATVPVSTAISGLALWNDRETPLGTADVVANACSWNDLYLMCPGTTGIEVWRIAN